MGEEEEERLKARVATLEAENTQLLQKVRALEEENDLLALDNERLREQAAAKAAVKGEGDKGDKAAAAAGASSGLWDSPMAQLATAAPGAAGKDDNKVGIFNLPPDASYLEEGDGRFPQQEAFTIEGISTLNPICCRLVPLLSTNTLLIATGGVDNFLTLHTVTTDGTCGGGYAEAVKVGVVGGFPGPLLSLDVAPGVVEVVEAREDADDPPRHVRRVRPALVTCMDGSHCLVHLDVGGGDVDVGEGSRVVGVYKGHEKHAVVGRFSPCGTLFATGGHDKKVCVYDAGTGAEKKQLFFTGNVEALAWVEIDEDGAAKTNKKTPYLVVASRNVAHLTYLNCHTWEKRTVSLNQAEWDDHVSFAVLDLKTSPCGQYLLAATDKSRLIVYRIGSHLHLRNLYGHRADEYSSPRAVWDRTGKYIFCCSQDGNELVGWSIASERVVAHLKGHTGIVRDVCYEPESGLLASVGYDKTLRAWRTP